MNVKQSIVVVGAGGHASVVADSLVAAGQRVLGFLDPRPELAGTNRCGLPVLGGDDILEGHSPDETLLANGIGSVCPSSLRADVQARLESSGWRFVGARHPSAIVSGSATVSASAQLLARCVVQPSARIGTGAIINTGAIIEHDVDIGAYVHVAPGAIVCGDVVIGKGSHIGAGAVVRQGTNVGPYTLVAAGAVVIRNHPGEGILMGVPASLRRHT